MAQLDKMTQQNAALVEQSAAAAESLKDQTVRLSQAVSVFRLHDAMCEPATHRHRVPGALVDELLQRLLQRVGIRVRVTAGQPGGHRLDRLAPAVQQQPAQVAVAPAALILAGKGLEQVLGEGGQAGADAAKLCGCHGVPPARWRAPFGWVYRFRGVHLRAARPQDLTEYC